MRPNFFSRSDGSPPSSCYSPDRFRSPQDSNVVGRSPFLIDQAQEPTPHQTTFLLPIQTDHCSTLPPFASYSASHRNPLWRAVCASASQAETCHPLPPSVPVSSPTEEKVPTDQEIRFRRTFVAVADSPPLISLSQVAVSSDRYCVLTTCIVSRREFMQFVGSRHSPPGPGRARRMPEGSLTLPG